LKRDVRSMQRSSTPSFYEKQGLRRIRLRRRLMWGTLLSFLPGAVLVGHLGLSTKVLNMMGAAWLAAAVVFSFVVAFSRCPRCGKLFHSRQIMWLLIWSNAFTRRCLNCALALKEDKLN